MCAVRGAAVGGMGLEGYDEGRFLHHGVLGSMSSPEGWSIATAKLAGINTKLRDNYCLTGDKLG